MEICDISFRHTIGNVIVKLQGENKFKDVAYMVRCLKVYLINVEKFIYVQVDWTFTISCYKKKSNLLNLDDQVFINDCEFIHIDSWAKDDSCMSMIFNCVDEKSHSQTLSYDDVMRKLTYEDKEAKGEIVNVHKKPQLLINYLIDICLNEGDWVLDLFSGSGKFYYIELNFNILFF